MGIFKGKLYKKKNERDKLLHLRQYRLLYLARNSKQFIIIYR